MVIKVTCQPGPQSRFADKDAKKHLSGRSPVGKKSENFNVLILRILIRMEFVSNPVKNDFDKQKPSLISIYTSQFLVKSVLDDLNAISVTQRKGSMWLFGRKQMPCVSMFPHSSERLSFSQIYRSAKLTQTYYCLLFAIIMIKSRVFSVLIP